MKREEGGDEGGGVRLSLVMRSLTKRSKFDCDGDDDDDDDGDGDGDGDDDVADVDD